MTGGPDTARAAVRPSRAAGAREPALVAGASDPAGAVASSRRSRPVGLPVRGPVRGPPDGRAPRRVRALAISPCQAVEATLASASSMRTAPRRASLPQVFGPDSSGRRASSDAPRSRPVVFEREPDPPDDRLGPPGPERLDDEPPDARPGFPDDDPALPRLGGRDPPGLPLEPPAPLEPLEPALRPLPLPAAARLELLLRLGRSPEAGDGRPLLRVAPPPELRPSAPRLGGPLRAVERDVLPAPPGLRPEPPDRAAPDSPPDEPPDEPRALGRGEPLREADGLGDDDEGRPAIPTAYWTADTVPADAPHHDPAI